MSVCDDANDITTVEYWELNQNRYGKKAYLLEFKNIE